MANIASPGTVRNLAHSSKVCLCFVDVFVQKGYKVTGTARNVGAKDEDFPTWAELPLTMAGPRFPIRSVIVIRALGVEPILAPSYRLLSRGDNRAESAGHEGTYGCEADEDGRRMASRARKSDAHAMGLSALPVFAAPAAPIL